MRWMNRLNGLAGVMLGLVMVCGASADVALSPQARGYLEQTLTPDQVREAMQTLAQVEQGTLGPQSFDSGQRERLAGPSRRVTLDPAQVARDHGLEGEGTAEKPYRGVLARFLAGLEPQAIMVSVPAGHYEELGLDLPEGVWLRSAVAQQAVIQAPAGDPSEHAGYLVSLVSRSGLVGFTLDGSRMPFTWRDGQWRDQAMRLPEGCLDGVRLRRGTPQRGAQERDIVVAENVLRHFPGSGITGERFRRRWAATEVLVIGNHLENIGHAGIAASAGWTVCHNTVHFAGILRPDGGKGHDGIIVSWSNSAQGAMGVTEVAHNLVVVSRQITGYGRHGIANHSAHEVTVRGNLVILEGQTRGGLRFSDGCHRNRIIGNVVVQRGVEDRLVTRDGIGVSGWGNQVLGNAVFGTTFFLHTNRMAVPAGEAPEGNTIDRNHARTLRGQDALSVHGGSASDVLIDSESLADRNRFESWSGAVTQAPLPKQSVPTFWFEQGQTQAP